MFFLLSDDQILSNVPPNSLYNIRAATSFLRAIRSVERLFMKSAFPPLLLKLRIRDRTGSSKLYLRTNLRRKMRVWRWLHFCPSIGKSAKLTKRKEDNGTVSQIRRIWFIVVVNHFKFLSVRVISLNNDCGRRFDKGKGIYNIYRFESRSKFWNDQMILLNWSAQEL